MDLISFKQRVCDTIKHCAADYKSVFLDCEYLIYSEDFKKNPYYILKAEEGNYKHLTGVNSNIAPYDFFQKCINNTLTENDFDFIRKGMPEAFTKGIVRNKIIALPLMMNMFNEPIIAQENFRKGLVACSVAASDNNITIGFENRIVVRPKTLLRGNELEKGKTVDVSLVLKRSTGAVKFDTIVRGDNEIYVNFRNKNVI